MSGTKRRIRICLVKMSKKGDRLLIGKGGINYSLAAKPIKSGGEGEIYDVNGKPGIVVKIYKPGKATSEKELKLIKMIAFPPDASVLAQIAWPQDVLYENGQFIGFSMQKMNVNEDLNVIYEYGASAKYPHMTWANKITIAQNLCAVLNSIHGSGHVCGDLNPKNISVNPTTGHIVFLDTDSYHIYDGINVYRCDVGIPEYLPAEVQAKMRGGANLAGASLPTFTECTDNFALAVHIFQLLMNGVHPFACAIIPSQSSVVAPQPADSILKGRFPFMQDIPGIRIPAYAPETGILPRYVQHLFERAFIAGHANPDARPTAIEWHDALRSLKGELRLCASVSHHMYFAALPSCSWCDVDRKFVNIAKPNRVLSQEAIGPVVAAPTGANVFVSPPPQTAVTLSTPTAYPSTWKNTFASPPTTYVGAQSTSVTFKDNVQKRVRSGLFVFSILCTGAAAYFLYVLDMHNSVWWRVVGTPWEFQFGLVHLFRIFSFYFFLVPLVCQIWILADAKHFKTGGLAFFIYKLHVFICMGFVLLFIALLLTPYELSDYPIRDFWLIVHAHVVQYWQLEIEPQRYYIEPFMAIVAASFTFLAVLYFRSVFKVINDIRLGIKSNSDAYVLMERNAKKLAVYTVLMGLFCVAGVFYEQNIFMLPLVIIIGSIPLVATIFMFDKSLRQP